MDQETDLTASSEPQRRKRSRWVSFVGFFQRALRRSFGLEQVRVPGQNLSPLASRYLAHLSAPPDSLRFRIALEELRHAYDLTGDEEQALIPEVRDLRTRIVALSSTEETAFEICQRDYSQSPIAKLFGAIVQLASEADSAVVVDFALSQDHFFVLGQENGKWKEDMRVPASLGPHLRGACVMAEHLGYTTFRALFVVKKPLREDISFQWLSQDRFLIAGPDSSG
ncbi:MAG: hypothetical protein K1X67_15580 [Fimbriimonadaceae bacterium]|nr:hypothetical protein [Fimbriimonadaceae bacterium]